jgi:putative YphP/YqiW family bacilliredoxin
MYPAELVMPMKAELTGNGFEELLTAEEVENHLTDHKGTTLVVINSVCGCAAGAARPGVVHSLRTSEKKPDNLKTVFAGFDAEAVQKVRELHMPYPPSSPSIALFKDGELVHFVERHHIEGRNAQMIADHLVQVYEEYC